ncbi:MAG: DEAD/DEAH box helicase [Clostridiales bacterium]|nr:DEAD/DEAH box helicase [Clostridiales bacterium]MDY4655934.1 DEAD/DEAH box helicase [Eubacteriales bacterium]
MNKIELLNAINNYSFDGKDEEIINLLNDLLDSGDYKAYLNLVFNAISITQMYGFLAYLTDDEQKIFLQWDKLRSDSYGGKKIRFYNSGQLSLLFDLEQHNKVFLSAPTSFGKTSLILEYIISNFEKLNNVLLIVPTNSLLEELFAKIIEINKFYKLGYSISTQPYFQSGVKNFLIITPERFLLLYEEIDINSFDLIVMDETYKIVDSKNECISDFIDSRAVRFRKVADIIGKTSKKLFLLSPFTYLLTQSMQKYLTKYEIKKLDRKMEYVKREIHEISNAQSFKEHFKLRVVGYAANSSAAQKTNLLLRVLQDEKNIVYVSQYAKAYDIVEALDWTRKLNKSERYIKFLAHLEKNYSIDDKYEWKIISALKKGVGIYISPLPRYIKREIIRLYEENVLGTLIVTTSFTEGVNTNASNLIFTSLINGPNTNKLSDIDVLNVSGRAGRFAKNSIGKIYCITHDVYQKVLELQNSATIQLENYNYHINNFEPRIDYEIDMIDDEFLSNEEKNIKSQIREEMDSLNLTTQELHLSLNVSTKWKLILYKYFSSLNNTLLAKCYSASIDVLNSQPNKRIESLNFIFDILRKSFLQAEIEGFPCQPYEIKAFDTQNKFVWGRLYKVYCSGNISKVIANNIVFVQSRFDEVNKKYSLQNDKLKRHVEPFFEKESLKWILKYYTNELNLNFDAFYSETFKFISSIIQYKVPFYTSYFVSILKLFLTKTNKIKDVDLSKLDAKKISLLFEDGSIYDDYSKMIDYGISNDLIMKLHENQISIENLKTGEFSKSDFDEYELLLIEEFLQIA